jgi:streptomycin 3"-adenylyltransferase
MSEAKLLHTIAAGYREILGGDFVGLYVHGSLAFGCYRREVSDMDFIVVVSAPPSEDARVQMIRLLLSLEPEAPAKGFEMSVVLDRYCRDFVYPTPYELHYSCAHREAASADISAYCEKMRGTDRDLAAHFTVIRAVGYALEGPPVHALFGEVPREAYIDSLLYDVENAVSEILDAPMYLTLNLCRVLAYLRDGAVLSKKQGGEWGLAMLPERWHPQIRAALAAYAGESAEFPADLQKFAAWMLYEIRVRIS